MNTLNLVIPSQNVVSEGDNTTVVTEEDMKSLPDIPGECPGASSSNTISMVRCIVLYVHVKLKVMYNFI